MKHSCGLCGSRLWSSDRLPPPAPPGCHRRRQVPLLSYPAAAASACLMRRCSARHAAATQVEAAAYRCFPSWETHGLEPEQMQV